MYSSTLDPSNKDPLHTMEGEQLATLEQALAELQAKDANTQHKLDPYFPYSTVRKSDPIYTNHISHSEGPRLKTGPSVGV